MSDAEDETRERRGVSYADNFFGKDESGFKVEIVAATHVGRVRRRNEDHYAAARCCYRICRKIASIFQKAMRMV